MTSTLAAPSALPSDERTMPSPTGVFLTGEQLALLSVAAGSVAWFMKWAWDRFWKRSDAAELELKTIREKARDEVLARVEAGITNVTKKVDEDFSRVGRQMSENFAELRGLINNQAVTIHGLEVELGALKTRLDRAERKVDNVPEMIVQSRHQLRDELQGAIVTKARQMAAALQKKPPDDQG